VGAWRGGGENLTGWGGLGPRLVLDLWIGGRGPHRGGGGPPKLGGGRFPAAETKNPKPPGLGGGGSVSGFGGWTRFRPGDFPMWMGTGAGGSFLCPPPRAGRGGSVVGPPPNRGLGGGVGGDRGALNPRQPPNTRGLYGGGGTDGGGRGSGARHCSFFFFSPDPGGIAVRRPGGGQGFRVGRSGQIDHAPTARAETSFGGGGGGGGGGRFHISTLAGLFSPGAMVFVFLFWPANVFGPLDVGVGRNFSGTLRFGLGGGGVVWDFRPQTPGPGCFIPPRGRGAHSPVLRVFPLPVCRKKLRSLGGLSKKTLSFFCLCVCGKKGGGHELGGEC
jgi:hypothetical protein